MTGPLEPKSFHVSVQNSQGSFPEPGTLLGRAEATGSYEQCLNLEPTYDYVYDENWQKVGQYDFKMNYCKTRYFTKDNLVSDPFNANSFSWIFYLSWTLNRTLFIVTSSSCFWHIDRYWTFKCFRGLPFPSFFECIAMLMYRRLDPPPTPYPLGAYVINGMPLNVTLERETHQIGLN